jgi:adenosylmethionine-8-amino-7-oxononanoate aminotransferase
MADEKSARPLTRVLQRQIHHTYPVAIAGEGVHVIDRDGKRYIDASGGAAVSCLGHGHPAIGAAMKAQIDKLAFAYGQFFTTDVAEQLADTLIADAPAGLSHVFYVSGGSEGVEAALKMARQYFVEKGEPQRKYFIARHQSYHGNTLGALAVGGNAMRRALYAPLLAGNMHHIDACYAYRGQAPEETLEAYGLRMADQLETKIQELGAANVIGFVAEPVVGATLGCVTAAPGYFKRIREICDRHGILLILDEVMCGMGRTGTLHASEQEGISPDLCVIAKGLGAGYAAIGAVLLSSKIFETFAAGSGAFMHGHTYGGHPVALAAGLAVQKVIKDENLLANVATQGERLERRLRERFGNHHHVGDVRGRGLFWAIELVADRATKAAFDPARKLHLAIRNAGMARGLMCYPMGGTIDGRSGDHVVLAPPFIADGATIDTIVERLGEAVDAAIAA